MLHIRTMLDQNLLVGLVVLAVVGFAVYTYFPKLKAGLSGMEGFADPVTGKKHTIKTPAPNGAHHGKDAGKGAADRANKHSVPTPRKEGFADFADFGGTDSVGMGPVPMAAAQKPAGCFPREQLNPAELLPADPNSQWAQVNPTGAGDIQGKNFLSAGALIGVNTIGQSMKNANLQLRAEPPNPQVAVSPWNISTIEPDLMRKPLE